jgi:hypothetical protein
VDYTRPGTSSIRKASTNMNFGEIDFGDAVPTGGVNKKTFLQARSTGTYLLGD